MGFFFSSLLLTLLGISPLAFTADPPGPRSELLQGPNDEIVRRTFVPTPENVHGEVRLIRRGPGVCAQTLFYSPALRRGIQRIRKEEKRLWPEGSDGADDSSAYLTALAEARTRVLDLFDRRSDRDDRRQKLLIEFVLMPDRAFWALYELEITDREGGVEIRNRTPIAVGNASRSYVRKTMQAQMEKAFGADSVDLLPLLELE